MKLLQKPKIQCFKNIQNFDYFWIFSKNFFIIFNPLKFYEEILEKT